jgi:hypothetical protein
MNDFLDKARDLLANHRTQGKENEFERVFDALVEMRPVFYKSYLDLDNIESVFAAFEMAHLINKLGNLQPEEIELLENSIKTLIVVTLDNSIQYPTPTQQAHPPVPYGAFCGYIAGKLEQDFGYLSSLVTFITFNYDTALDYSLRFHNIPLKYCLEMETKKETAIKLIKLHGSLNWRKCPNPQCGKINFAPIKSQTIHSTKGYVNIQHPTIIKCECDASFSSVMPFIVPPTMSKGEHHKELGNVWATAAKEMEEAENIFVIGYSLPENDLFFRYLFALGTVGKGHLKRFWVFDPDNGVEKRFRKLIGRGIENRFKFYQKTFEQAIDEIREVL